MLIDYQERIDAMIDYRKPVHYLGMTTGEGYAVCARCTYIHFFAEQIAQALKQRAQPGGEDVCCYCFEAVGEVDQHNTPIEV